jgi:hypothetical protein
MQFEGAWGAKSLPKSIVAPRSGLYITPSTFINIEERTHSTYMQIIIAPNLKLKLRLWALQP